ncbi:MAG: class I SAM-dependent methyltransferase [Desulfuromonadaceae bacterium]
MNLVEYRRMYEVEESHWWYVGLHRLILAAVQRESARLGRPVKIFDAGCGTGRLCQLLSDQGYDVSGCDASEEALRLCRERGVSGLFSADLNTIELEAERFDIITSLDVLYHTGIHDDGAVMKRLRNALKPGGMLILNLVAFEFLRSSHDIAVHTRERYTRSMLCRRVHESGFDISFATYRVSLLFPLIAGYRLLVRSTSCRAATLNEVVSDVSSPHRLINALLLKTIELENRLFELVSLPFGSSIFILARKR